MLDWELCTLGDPLADVGLLLVYWAEPGDQTLLGSAPTVMPGFPRRAAVAEAYAARSGRDLSSWTCTWPSPPGSWPSSSRAWSPATPGAYGEGDDTWRGFAEVVVQLADRALELTDRL